MPQIKLSKLTPVRIYERIVEQIRGLIITGVIRPGDKLPAEQELEKQLSVSRSSIREALLVLEYEGLVEIRRGSGTYVAPYSRNKKGRIEVTKWLEQREDTICELLQIREYLEGLSASLAAARADQKAVDELVDILNEIKVVIKNPDFDVEKLTGLDSQFHLTISRLGGNNLVIELLTYVIPAFQASNSAIIYFGQTLDQLIPEHTAIVSAIAANDPTAAENAMRGHIRRVKEDICNLSHLVSQSEAEV